LNAEEYVAEDWTAVSRAVNQRMDELGLNQRELIERSQVSRATVGEIRRNEAQRRRSTRTLEALSIALDWHPQRLAAVLRGHRLPELGEPVARSEDIPGRLDAIEYLLQQIAKKLEDLDSLSERVDEIHTELKSALDVTERERRRIGS
jgi:transcriptional regulator with XRE-family HTH domain